jgi:hypothetical protein
MFRFRKKKVVSKPREVFVNIVDEDFILEFCYRWSVQFPIDRWWRDKHKVAFGSPEHRAMSLLDMRFEFEEDEIFRKNKRIKDYVPNKGEWMKPEVITDSDANLTQEEKFVKYKEEFSKIDLSQYNDK